MPLLPMLQASDANARLDLDLARHKRSGETASPQLPDITDRSQRRGSCRADFRPTKMLHSWSKGSFKKTAMQRLGIRPMAALVAPALQAFSVDIGGHFRQYRRLSGLFMRWCSAGPPSHRCKQRLPGSG